MATKIYHYLKTDGGGIDWDGLEIVCAWMGVQDVDLLLTRLMTIKTYERPVEDR